TVIPRSVTASTASRKSSRGDQSISCLGQGDDDSGAPADDGRGEDQPLRLEVGRHFEVQHAIEMLARTAARLSDASIARDPRKGRVVDTTAIPHREVVSRDREMLLTGV